MKVYTKPNHQQGFTLIELMITVTILGIVAALAIPSMTNQFAKKRMKTAEQLILRVHKEARAESSIRNQSILIEFNRVSTQEYIKIIAKAADGTYTKELKKYDFPNQTRIVDSTNTGITGNTRYLVNGAFMKNLLTPTASENMIYHICDTGISGEISKSISYQGKSKPSSTTNNTCS